MHVEDQLPALLLGELPPAEADAVSAHLDGCDDCRRDLAVFARTSAALTDAADLPFGEPLELPPLVLPSDHPAAEPRSRRRHGRTSPWVRRGAVAAAAALVAVLGGTAVSELRGPTVTATVALAPVNGSPASGQASMLGEGGAQRMDVVVTGLPAPGEGRYYEVWLLDAERGRVQAVGVLPPDGHGTYALPASVSDGYPTVDVSLELDDGNPGHSDDSVLRGSTS